MSLITSSWSVLVDWAKLTDEQSRWVGRYRATTHRLHSFRDHPDRAALLIECDDEVTAMNVHDVLTGVLPQDAVGIVSFGEEV